jgi:hypothetical protein
MVATSAFLDVTEPSNHEPHETDTETDTETETKHRPDSPLTHPLKHRLSLSLFLSVTHRKAPPNCTTHPPHAKPQIAGR